MQSDSNIAAGQAARKIGRYDQAVAAFQRAAGRPEIAAEARELEFRALREVDISQHLVGRLLRRIGMSPDRYKGFAAIDPPLDAATVRHRLDALAAAPPGHAGNAFRPLLDADRVTRGEASALAAETSEATTGLDLRVARARHELRRGRPGQARAWLGGAMSYEAPSAAAQAILGASLWQVGDKNAAINAFNLSLLYLGGTSSHGQLRFQTAYKNFRIVYYHGQFYAVPDWRDPILDDSGGEAKLVAHRVPRWLRHWLRSRLPPRLLDFLHGLLTMTALRGEMRLEQLVHSPDLLSVLRALDDQQSPKR